MSKEYDYERCIIEVGPTLKKRVGLSRDYGKHVPYEGKGRNW